MNERNSFGDSISMKLSIVVAMSENRVIGIKNQLPWKIPEDLKRFKEITWGHPVIMGRKTFESIGRLLPGRENIILSRQVDCSIAGGLSFSSLDKALEHCKKENSEKGEVFIIGGAEIYRMAIQQVDRIYLTMIHKSFEGDAFFPEFSQDFREVHREDREGPISFSFLIFDRIHSLI